jgi:hypothetical protein
MSIDGTDTDEERTIIMGMTVDLLHVITETRVLNPHIVTFSEFHGDHSDYLRHRSGTASDLSLFLDRGE